MIDFAPWVDAVNAVGFILFLVLLGASLYSMVSRVRWYRSKKKPLPTLLKRGIFLLGALLLLGGEAMFLRAFGIVMADLPPHLRLVYILQADAIVLSALAYYTKTEYSDMGDPGKP